MDASFQLLFPIRSEIFGLFLLGHLFVNFYKKFGEYADRISEVVCSFGPIEIECEEIGYFNQKTVLTLHLDVSKKSLERMRSLFKIIQKAIPEVEAKHKQFNPHLTLGQCSKDALEDVKKEMSAILPIKFTARDICMVAKLGI